MTYKLAISILSTATGLALFALPASASDVSVLMPSGVSVQYDPFTSQAGLQAVSVEVSYSGATPKQARLVITPETDTEFVMANAGERVEFVIEGPAGMFTPSRFEMPISLVPSSAPQIIELEFKIPAGQYADAALFESDLVFTLEDATSSMALSEDFLRASTNIPARAQTNFAGANAGYLNGTSFALVDFGEIEVGARRNINFQVRGNTNVLIEVSSENHGTMVNTAMPSQHPIPYRIVADGEALDLSAPQSLMRRPERSLAGSSYPMEVIIGKPDEGLFSGQYRDIITIDVTPG